MLLGTISGIGLSSGIMHLARIARTITGRNLTTSTQPQHPSFNELSPARRFRPDDAMINPKPDPDRVGTSFVVTRLITAKTSAIASHLTCE